MWFTLRETFCKKRLQLCKLKQSQSTDFANVSSVRMKKSYEIPPVRLSFHKFGVFGPLFIDDMVENNMELLARLGD